MPAMCHPTAPGSGETEIDHINRLSPTTLRVGPVASAWYHPQPSGGGGQRVQHLLGRSPCHGSQQSRLLEEALSTPRQRLGCTGVGQAKEQSRQDFTNFRAAMPKPQGRKASFVDHQVQVCWRAEPFQGKCIYQINTSSVPSCIPPC
jgi:hypothetical protein